jgi:NTE family protein
MKHLRPVNYSSFKFKGLGLFENSEIQGLLEKLLPEKAKIQDARIPLAIKATNILNGNGVVLFQGEVIPAVLGSCCVPGIYTPSEIDGMLLVDGGLTENVPLSAIKHLGANIRIGVNLNGNAGYTRPEGIFDVVSNAIDIAIDAQTRKQLEEAHITISMDLTKYSRTSSEDFDELILEGMNATKRVIKSQGLLRFWVILKKIKYFLRATMPLKIPELK